MILLRVKLIGILAIIALQDLMHHLLHLLVGVIIDVLDFIGHRFLMFLQRPLSDDFFIGTVINFFLFFFELFDWVFFVGVMDDVLLFLQQLELGFEICLWWDILKFQLVESTASPDVRDLRISDLLF